LLALLALVYEGAESNGNDEIDRCANMGKTHRSKSYNPLFSKQKRGDHSF
jgi:hypothetical protein